MNVIAKQFYPEFSADIGSNDNIADAILLGKTAVDLKLFGD